MTATISKPCSDGTTIDVLPEGLRIRSVKHPRLAGSLAKHECHESGKISPIPYCIQWDDSAEARDVLGRLFVYAGVDQIEPEPGQETTP